MDSFSQRPPLGISENIATSTKVLTTGNRLHQACSAASNRDQTYKGLKQSWKSEVSHLYLIQWLCSMESSDSQVPSISLLHRGSLYFKVPHGPSWLLQLKTWPKNVIQKEKAEDKQKDLPGGGGGCHMVIFVVFWGRFPQAALWWLWLYLIGQNLITWAHLAAKVAWQCSVI